MPAAPWFPDLETLGSGVGGVILSSRVRDGNQACKDWGVMGRCTRAATQRAESGPLPKLQEGLGRAGGPGEHTCTKPPCLLGRKPFVGAGGRHSAGQEETLLAQLHIRQPRNILCFPPPSPPAQDGAGNAVE